MNIIELVALYGDARSLTVIDEEHPSSGPSMPPRGFARMKSENPEAFQEVAARGGRSAHAKGLAHEWTKEEAALASRKGGKAISQDRAHMAEIGRKGGAAKRSQRAGS